jgi:hypothetical protein
MGFFNWIRTAARNAVLSGVSDALEELAPAADESPAPDLARLRSLAAKQLAAKADDEEPAKGKRKAG